MTVDHRQLRTADDRGQEPVKPGHRRLPRVVGLDELPRGSTQLGPECGVPEKTDDKVGELFGIVLDQEVAPWPRLEPFMALGGPDHREPHRHRLEHLVLDPARDPEGRHGDGGLLEEWSDVRHGAAD